MKPSSPRFGRLFWKLFLINAVIMATLLVICLWAILAQLERFHDRELTAQLTARAQTLAVMTHDRFASQDGQSLDELAKALDADGEEEARITFIAANGRVLGDSWADPARMESHQHRPEILQAVADGHGEITRWSKSVSRNLKYVAVRVGMHAKPLGVVRVAMAARTIAQQVRPTRLTIAALLGASVLATVMLAMGSALLWSRRIARITEAAQHLSAGDLSTRIDVTGRDEVATLARSLNQMGERLGDHLGTIDRQRRTLDALMSQLREGVVVADREGRIVLINAEARQQLRLSPPEPEGWWVGQPIERCVPLGELQRMLAGPAVREQHGQPSSEAHEGETEVRQVTLQVGPESRDLTVLARAFNVLLPEFESHPGRGGRGALPGRILVLTDVTEFAKLVEVKADFAANASHELRTPLAAIRAALETLHDLDWTQDADSANRFLDVISRQGARMEAMVSDLLDLSRIETPSARFKTEPVSPVALVDELHNLFEDSIASKGLVWEAEVEPSCDTININPDLLRIALRNLVDNAIRFTASGGFVRVSVCRHRQDVEIAVADDGCGIPDEDKRRVFERFYQVESARSGSDRGTGLGLSIVRHAIATMNGHIELESRPGVGTTVTIRIPQTA